MKWLRAVLVILLALALLLGSINCATKEPSPGGKLPVDDTPPKLSSILASSITESSATIDWITNEAATGQVEYGITSTYGRLSNIDTQYDTDHSITLINLDAGVKYHYRVNSKDKSGKEAISIDYTFTTLAAISELPKVTGSIDCSFAWEYAGSEWTWDIPISKALYEYYHARERVHTDDYSVYVTDPLDDSFIDNLASKIKDAAKEKSFNEFETVNFAVAFVQSLPYTSDQVTTSYDEYPRYPIETLLDNGGDCEDTSILMAAILKAMNYGVVLVNPTGHMAVGVLGGEGIYGSYYNHDGGKYYYLETTGSEWEIGEIPTEYKGDSVRIYDIVPIPILTHTWETTNYTSYSRLQITVKNIGTATAYGIYIFAGFDAGGDMVWSTEQSAMFDLQAGYSKSITLILQTPYGKHTRLVVQIVDDGYKVDESFSEWFDT